MTNNSDRDKLRTRLLLMSSEMLRNLIKDAESKANVSATELVETAREILFSRDGA